MTGLGDVAGRLVETAARAQFKASHPRDSWDDDLHPEEQAIAKHLMGAVLADVLPQIADEVATNAAPAIRSAADLTREDADGYSAATARGLARGQQVVEALLRDLAVRVAR